MNIDYKAIGKNIRVARIKAGLTQEQLAEKTSLSTTHISNIETGNTKLSLPSIVTMSNVLSVSLDELLYCNVFHSKVIYDKRAKEIFDDCNELESRLLIEILESTKSALRNDSFIKEKLT